MDLELGQNDKVETKEYMLHRRTNTTKLSRMRLFSVQTGPCIYSEVHNTETIFVYLTDSFNFTSTKNLSIKIIKTTNSEPTNILKKKKKEAIMTRHRSENLPNRKSLRII